MSLKNHPRVNHFDIISDFISVSDVVQASISSESVQASLPVVFQSNLILEMVQKDFLVKLPLKEVPELYVVKIMII